MKEDSGNLWTYDAEFRVITTNGDVTKNGLVMGAGVALQAKRRFPDLPKRLGWLVTESGNQPYYFEREGIITLPTKHHWRNPSTIELIVSSIWKLVTLVDDLEITSVVMTRPGCGNGQLQWPDVRLVIEPLLDNRFTVLSGA